MSWNKVETDIGQGPLGAIKWFVIIILFLFVFFGALNAIGLIGGKAVERQVLKHSHQYKEGMDQRAAILQANIAELDILIAQRPANVKNLENQKLILQAQLRAITINE